MIGRPTEGSIFRVIAPMRTRCIMECTFVCEVGTIVSYRECDNPSPNRCLAQNVTGSNAGYMHRYKLSTFRRCTIPLPDDAIAPRP